MIPAPSMFPKLRICSKPRLDWIQKTPKPREMEKLLDVLEEEEPTSAAGQSDDPLDVVIVVRVWHRAGDYAHENF